MKTRCTIDCNYEEGKTLVGQRGRRVLRAI